MIHYTWNINSITKKTINQIDDVIFTIVWEKFGIDQNGFSGSFKTSTGLSIDDISLKNFIQYENLSESIIIDWIKSVIDEEEINKYIQNQIERSKNKEIQVENGNFPWQVGEEI